MIGIYKITNKVNNDCYIGQSIEIERRWKDHLYLYSKKNTKSYNYHLYKAFRKYGIERFIFEVIEECSKKLLTERETYYYEMFKPTYNEIYPKTNPTLNENVKKRIPGLCKEAWERKSLDEKNKSLRNLDKTQNRYSKKSIKTINIETGEILYFDSMYEAEKKIGVKRSSISQIINPNHPRKQANGFTFELCEQNPISCQAPNGEGVETNCRIEDRLLSEAQGNL